jgi:hypothetical protein
MKAEKRQDKSTYKLEFSKYVRLRESLAVLSRVRTTCYER